MNEREKAVDGLACAIFMKLQELEPWENDTSWSRADEGLRMLYKACAERILLDDLDILKYAVKTFRAFRRQ